ncbi:MAG: D-arabinono-1,4-lactone oxidase, partial [Candidatus Latescibacterota bacterium]|nr:D-arabinono-1,4-lactone oxidase [Candidatus Latescibacterota bacterium]
DGRFDVPFFFPSFALNTWSMGVFNTLFYHRQWRRSTDGLVHYDPYFYPLDAIHRWNRIYGRRGFLQYQVVVPYRDGEEIMAELLGRIASRGIPSLLTVLKSFGPANDGLLSFPTAGYTLALDIPMRDEGLIPFLRELNKTLVRAKGRVYLAKDAILEREDFAAMYPQLEEFKAIKRKYDPQYRFRSRLSDRLGIT